MASLCANVKSELYIVANLPIGSSMTRILIANCYISERLTLKRLILAILHTRKLIHECTYSKATPRTNMDIARQLKIYYCSDICSPIIMIHFLEDREDAQSSCSPGCTIAQSGVAKPHSSSLDSSPDVIVGNKHSLMRRFIPNRCPILVL